MFDKFNAGIWKIQFFFIMASPSCAELLNYIETQLIPNYLTILKVVFLVFCLGNFMSLVFYIYKTIN